MRYKPFKKPVTDPRRSNDSLLGGRRVGEQENPYLSARRTWNEHMQTLIAARQACKSWACCPYWSLSSVSPV